MPVAGSFDMFRLLSLHVIDLTCDLFHAQPSEGFCGIETKYHQMLTCWICLPQNATRLFTSAANSVHLELFKQEFLLAHSLRAH